MPSLGQSYFKENVSYIKYKTIYDMCLLNNFAKFYLSPNIVEQLSSLL